VIIAVSSDLLDNVLPVLGLCLLVISLFLIILFFSKNQKVKKSGEIRNFILTSKDKEALISVLQDNGFALCEEEDPFVVRRAEFSTPSVYMRLALFRENDSGRKTYVGVDSYRRKSFYYTIFFSQDIVLSGDEKNNGREPVDVLPFVTIRPSGSSFGFDETGAPEDIRSSLIRFSDSVTFSSKSSKEELNLIFDDAELKAAILDAFDRGVTEIQLQERGNGVLFRYARFDFESWTAGDINGLTSDLQIIVDRLPLAERVEYLTDVFRFFWTKEG
jgi:hypothetical protein